MKIVIGKATVLEILEVGPKIQKLNIAYNDDGKNAKAIACLDFVNPLATGDTVLVNSIAAELALGTGGYDFVVCNLSNPELRRDQGPGHIIKLPYTPFQSAVLSIEEADSEFHNIFTDEQNIEKMPVIICGLHSHIAPSAAMLKSVRPELKVSCIITDGAALPAAFSDTLNRMKPDVISNVITCGNAFGGDIEAVNIFTALIAAKHVENSDIAIVSMGPGIKGTETLYGHSGIEQGWIIDAVNTLDGQPVYSPRISFADKRSRHRGLSHHSLTVLSKIAKTGCKVAIPKIGNSDNLEIIKGQLKDNRIQERHQVIFREAGDSQSALEEFGLSAYSMGRSFGDDPVFFETSASAALIALELMGDNAK